MKNIFIGIALVVALVVAGTFAVGYMNEPRTYEDCVLKYTMDTNNSASAINVRNACKKKFPPEYLDEDVLFNRTTEAR